MAKLTFSAITSVDGYVADEHGRFDWAAPDEELHTVVNELERDVGTYLYGRRMYEVMVAWDDPALVEGAPPHLQDYSAIWRAADKIVYSTSLSTPSSERTRIEREFDVEAVRRLKRSSSADLSVGGPTLAAAALRAGLVDECHLFLVPVVVGGGQRFLPDRLFQRLALQDQRRFGDGTVHLHYRLS
jgi:dihydrofolate reductase